MKKENKTLTSFFESRIGELRNVTWPTKKQAVHSMILVLVIMLLVGVFLGIVDYGINALVLLLLNR